MKEETVVSLIMTGALSPKQVDDLVVRYKEYGAVFEAAVFSDYYSNEKLLEIFKNDPRNHTCFLWGKIVNSLKQENPKTVWKMMKIFAKRNMRYSDFTQLVELTFDFSGVFAEQISILKKLIRLAPDEKRSICRLFLDKRQCDKKELLAIGALMQNEYVWEDILIKRNGYAQLTKSEIISLLKKRSLSRDCYLELMRSKQAFPWKRMVTTLRRVTNTTCGTNTRDKIIEVIAEGRQYSAKKFLKLAREVNTPSVWEAFQEKYGSGFTLLNKKDIKNILLKGNPAWRDFAIKKLDTQTLRRIANPKDEKKRDVYLAGDIIKSRRFSKQFSIRLARKMNWYSVWIDLIESGYFTEDEAISLAKKEVKHHLSEVWRSLCSHIDLSKRDTEELLEFGANAESDEIWEKIIAELNKRKDLNSK